MRKHALFLLAALSAAALVFLVPRFNAAQPHGARLTRGDAIRLAEQHARAIGIPLDKAWSAVVWTGSPLLDKAVTDPEQRRLAHRDPVIGPRFGGYKVVYHRLGVDKSTPYGTVYLSAEDGALLAVRLRRRPETAGANATEAALRPRADAFVRSRAFVGAPSPQFESARPTVLRNRTDWIFRYRVPSSFPTPNVHCYLYVYFTGAEQTGFDLIEEFADGTQYRGETDELGGFFLLFLITYALLLILLVIFLRKYHAGEAGVGTATLLFIFALALLLAGDLLMYRSMGEGMQMGGVDARNTALAQVGFKFLFFDLPTSVLLFFAWAVGESYARERWGERLASFDALLRRDPRNATVGRSIVRGIVAAPIVAAASLLVGLIPMALGLATPSLGRFSYIILSRGGPAVAPFTAAIEAAIIAVVAILFVLAASSRKRMLPLGIVVATVIAMVWGTFEPPITPLLQRMLFSFGGVAVVIALFLAYDLLAATIGAFAGALLTTTLPLLSVVEGDLFQNTMLATAGPIAGLLLLGLAGLATRREIIYRYEDMAPHVRRIIERERVKAEIDAANRIQAALLPAGSPSVPGVSFASHYRAATEIGGDYFDFLPRPDGQIGIAFGDVAGHGLTSGIVMSMAKAALLVQLEYDASPRAVLNTLNEIVRKTAPKRMMMTFFFGLLDPRDQTLNFSSAGHLDPYVYRAERRRLEPLSSWGYPLGLRREAFREHTITFMAGDRLVLYSDGLIEAVDDDGEPFGFERFERMLLEHGRLSAEEMKRKILDSVKRFTRNRPPEDDQTLVVVAFEEVVDRVAIEPFVAASVN